MTRAFSMREPAGRWMRNNLISLVTNTSEMRESLLKRIVPEFFELGVAYEHSPLVAQQWQPAFARFDRQPAGLDPGMRVPDYPFAFVKGLPGQTLHEVLNPMEYALLLFTTEGRDDEYRHLEQLAHEVQKTYGKLVTPIVVVPGAHIQRQIQWDGYMLVYSGHPYHTLHYFFGASRPSTYVIRPDGYVAYRDQPLDGHRVQAYLQTVLSL